MLKYIKIKNFALIDSQLIEWGKGLNVLSGETGAGKSIILKALSFVMGARSDKENIRNGEDFLRVEVSFEDLSEKTCCVLSDLGLEVESYLIIVRSLSLDGKSDIRINGSLVTQGMLREIASTLIDIYGQFDQYSLLNAKEHLKILDSLADNNLVNLKAELGVLLKNKTDLLSRLKNCYSDPQERARTLELLNYQINEIKTANLKENEEDELRQQKSKMLAVEKIAEALGQIVSLNDDYADIGALGLLKQSVQSLNTIVDYDEKFNEYQERLRSASIEIEDVVGSIRAELDSLYFDNNELDRIEERLEVYSSFKKKYGSSLDTIIKYCEDAMQQVYDINNNEELINKINTELNDINKLIETTCAKITEIRKNVADKMEILISKELSDLSMKGARFKVDFKQIEAYSEGADNIEFVFSANIGEPLKSLAKVISGGEMSRFMLAYKNVIATKDAISTLVFDEIDAGISGFVGSKVAEKMANISNNYQVFVISHLPQLVSMGDNNYLIRKNTIEGQTLTNIEKLSEDGVIGEIARLSGLESSQNTHNYAKELRANACEFKTKLNFPN